MSNIKRQVVRQSKFRQTPTTGFYRYAATAHTIFAGSSNNRLACFDAAPHGGNVQRCLPHPVITSRSSVSETWLSAKFTVCLAFLPRFLYVHLAYKNMEPGQCNSSGFAMFFPISAMALMLALAQFLGIKPSRPVDPTCCSSLGAPPVPIAPRCQQHCCLALKSSSHCPAECNTKQLFQDFGLPKLYPEPPLCTTSRVAIIRSSYINPVIFTLYRRVLLNQSIGAVKLVATQPSPLGLPAIWHPTQPPSRQSGRGWNSTTDVSCVLNGYG